MPWCEDCSQHVRPNELAEAGTCPACGRALDTTPPKAPWHFKLLMASMTVYLGWRGWQGNGRVVRAGWGRMTRLLAGE